MRTSQLWRRCLRNQPLVAALCLFAAIATAHAEAPDRCEQSAPCRKILRQARQFFAGGRYNRARPEFEKAFALTEGKDTRLLMDIGRTQQLLGKLDEAVTTYRRFLATVPHDAPERDLVLPWLREALLTTAADEQSPPSASAPLSPTDKPSVAEAPAAPKSSEAIEARPPEGPADPFAPAVHHAPIEQPAAESSQRSPELPGRCTKEKMSRRKQLLIAGGAVAGAGLLGVIPSAWLVSLDGAQNGTSVPYAGQPTPGIIDTRPGYITGFALSGVAMAAGAGLLIFSARTKESHEEGSCVAR